MAKSPKKSSGKPKTSKSLTKKSLATTETSTPKALSKRRLFHGRRSKETEPSQPPVPLSNVWKLSQRAILVLWDNKGLFAGITLVYGILNLILAQGLANNDDFAKLKSQSSQIFSGHVNTISSGLATFVSLGGTSDNSANTTAGVYQFIFVIIVSLALIWALRKVISAKRVKVRDAYYRGMYPLIPFILVLFAIGLQLLPLIIGATLYNQVINNGIAVGFFEKLVWIVIFGILTLMSLYMISSSIFALYIVTLPDMRPVKALRMASKLVRHRRSVLIRKLIFLPIALLVVAAIIMLPIISWLTALSQWVYFLLSILVIPVVHSYLYNLYRELSSGNE